VAADTITYTSLISTTEKHARWEEAAGLLDQMRVAGLTPNMYTYSSLIRCENLEQ
jgi:pentatricopeptide repeat protein